jgi:hypothetical protein
MDSSKGSSIANSQFSSLYKALYGLELSSLFEEVSGQVVAIARVLRNDRNDCFQYHSSNGQMILFSLHVDDHMIARNICSHLHQSKKKEVNAAFEFNYGGAAKCLLDFSIM